MRRFVIFVIIFFFFGCSSAPKIKPYARKVMVDSSSLQPGETNRLLVAMHQGGWDILDRGKGLENVLEEQSRQHGFMKANFSPDAIPALPGDLRGVGAVLMPYSECRRDWNIFNQRITNCRQFMTLIDAKTGEVIAAVENESSISGYDLPSWEGTVEKLNESCQ